jgi:hypothetical protein
VSHFADDKKKAMLYHGTMTTLTFDTLKFADKLQASGFTQEQAKGAASAFAEVTAESTSQLATKADLREVEMRLNASIREQELRMTIKLGGMLVVLCGILVTAMKMMAG